MIMNSRQKGFTLIEVILILAILSILLAVAWPNLEKPLAHYQLRSSSMQLASDMRWVRQQSIFGKIHVANLHLSPRENLYLVREYTKVIERRVLPPGIEFHEVVLDASNTLYFTITGAPSIGGRIVLKNKFNETCSVYFMPSSGRIRVECKSDR